jgi:hypothetical protein
MVTLSFLRNLKIRDTTYYPIDKSMGYYQVLYISNSLLIYCRGIKNRLHGFVSASNENSPPIYWRV